MTGSPAAQLRRALAEPGIRVVPSCYDALLATFTELQAIAGFPEYFAAAERYST